jgi:Mat/Ecp fimbriae outer membrane usher protein
LRAFLLPLLLSTPTVAFEQAASAPPPQPAEPAKPVIFETEDPEGFDDLVEAREASLNLYIDGQSVGAVPVSLAPGTLRFVDPAALIPRLPTLKDQSAVITALKSALPSNAGLSCSPSPVTGCGRLDPDVIGVIVSRDAGRVDLFLAGGVRGEARNQLPDPPKGPPTLAGALGVQYTLSERGIDLTVQPRFVAGFGRGHVAADATFSGRQSSLDSAYWRRNGDRTMLSAGLLRSSPFSFIYFDRLVGVAWESSDATRIERGSGADTPILIDVPLQGRVEILRDGVLLDTQRISPGRIQIDTARLPGGAYDLTLKITDASGERTETRFFARAQGLPGYGDDQFFVEAGWNTAFRGQNAAFLPDLLSPTVRAGYNKRLGAQFGMSVRGEVTDKRQLAEIGATWLHNDWRLSGTLGGTADGEWAAALNASGHIGQFNWSLDGRKVQGAAQTGVRDFERGIGRSYEQISANGGFSGKNFSFNTGIIWRRDPPGRASYTILPNARWTLSQANGRRIELETSGSYGRDNWSLRAGLRISFYRGQSSTTLSAGTEGRHSNGQTRFTPVGSADWSSSRDTDLGPLQLRAGVSQQSDRLSGRLGANLRTIYADLSADAQIEEQLSSSSLYGRVETSFGYAGGRLAFGGGGFTGSGIVAQSPDADKDSRFTVRAYGANAQPIKGRQAVFVSTPQFSQGDIGINSYGGGSSFDTRNEAAVFYPGTVKRLVRTSTRVTAIYARLVDGAGKPIADAAVETRGGVSETDATGYVQIEVGRDAVLTAETDDGSQCLAKVPVLDAKAIFVDVGMLLCEAVKP